MLMPTIGTSRCGEIFVTNNADKWTFVCSHCQMATNDIGVFICHIRFDHLNGLQDFQQVKEVTPMTVIPVSNFFPSENDQEMESNRILENELPINSGIVSSRVSKIIDISSLTDSIATENVSANKNTILMPYPSHEIKEEIFKQQPDFHCVQENKGFANKTPGDNTSQAQQETIDIDEDEDTNHSETNSLCSTTESNDGANENIVDLATGDDNEASGSKRKRNYLEHSCDFCSMSFNCRNSLDIHIKKLHTQTNQEPLKCKKCGKTFRTVPGWKKHLKNHNKARLKCSICKVKHKSIYNFIAHVLTHESDTCFPCQVCGKMHTTKEERLEHWKMHAEQLPYNCNICYRRYRKQQYLTNHLKSHFQYQCQFCPNQFNADEPQKPPYVCSTCENSPEIKQRVQNQRLLANNRHVFDSDEDSSLASGSENKPFTAIDSKANDSCNNFSNSLHNIINKDDTVLEFMDEFEDDIGASGSSTKTPPMEDDNSQHKCNYCSELFKSQQEVLQHIVLSHDINCYNRFPYNCRHCSRGFQSKSGLRFHEKTHDKSKAFNCPKCFFTAYRENEFLTHAMTHETEFCFPCQVCAKIFSNNNEREKHYKSHMKDRPYGCNFCFRRFFQKHVLSQHLRAHGLYKCYLCMKTFNTERKPLKPYSCTSCKQNPS